MLHGNIDNCDIKIADFGLSALVRLDENGYDAEESKKRKGMYARMYHDDDDDDDDMKYDGYDDSG